MLKIYFSEKNLRASYQEEFQKEIDKIKPSNNFYSFIEIGLDDFTHPKYIFFKILNCDIENDDDLENKALLRNHFQNHSKFRLL